MHKPFPLALNRADGSYIITLFFKENFAYHSKLHAGYNKVLSISRLSIH